MSNTAGIVGAGLIGRLLALHLHDQGWQVTLFDRDDAAGTQSCAYVGAGMLAPFSELETAEPVIAQLGIESLALWPEILRTLDRPVFFQQAGTLIVSHHRDYPELNRFARTLKNKLFGEEKINWHLNQSEIQFLEPDLANRFTRGIYIPNEGQINNRQLLDALAHAIRQRGINWNTNQEVQKIEPHRIEDQHFDWVIDCRGLGAKPDLKNLRGVRGELIRVHAPEVSLKRPIRVMHPRYPLYVVPRENKNFLIGATSIESDDIKPLTVQSALELLSAAVTLHPGFAEATILEMNVQCRPTLPNHLPKIRTQAGLVRINGLYRHGFLISPKLVELASQYLETDQHEEYSQLFEEMPAYATCH